MLGEDPSIDINGQQWAAMGTSGTHVLAPGWLAMLGVRQDDHEVESRTLEVTNG